MLDIIEAFHQTGLPLEEEASQEKIQSVQKELDCVFPEELQTLYWDHNGQASPDKWIAMRHRRIAMRLMPLEEVVECHAFVKEYGFADRGLRLFWTDDNSNYAGLYVDGPLIGKICFIDHDEGDLSPVYASLRSFLHTLLAAIPQELDWFDFPTDYPALAPASDPQLALHDWEIAQSLLPLYHAGEEYDRIYYAFCVMALTPFEKSETLLPFTYDENMDIQARACEIIGKRRYEPAIDRLAEVVQTGFINGRSSAIWALGRIGSEAAHARLQMLMTALPDYATTFGAHYVP